MAYLDILSPAAQLCGSVNTVINDGGVLTGTVTDGTGWMHAVAERGIDLKGKKITLLGAGGAATAILVQAALDGVEEISMFNRQDEFWPRAEEKSALVREKTNCKVNLFHLEDRDCPAPRNWGLGAAGERHQRGHEAPGEPLPGGQRYAAPGLIVSDVVYNPRQTILLQRV